MSITTQVVPPLVRPLIQIDGIILTAPDLSRCGRAYNVIQWYITNLGLLIDTICGCNLDMRHDRVRFDTIYNK